MPESAGNTYSKALAEVAIQTMVEIAAMFPSRALFFDFLGGRNSEVSVMVWAQMEGWRGRSPLERKEYSILSPRVFVGFFMGFCFFEKILHIKKGVV